MLRLSPGQLAGPHLVLRAAHLLREQLCHRTVQQQAAVPLGGGPACPAAGVLPSATQISGSGHPGQALISSPQQVRVPDAVVLLVVRNAQRPGDDAVIDEGGDGRLRAAQHPGGGHADARQCAGQVGGECGPVGVCGVVTRDRLKVCPGTFGQILPHPGGEDLVSGVEITGHAGEAGIDHLLWTGCGLGQLRVVGEASAEEDSPTQAVDDGALLVGLVRLAVGSAASGPAYEPPASARCGRKPCSPQCRHSRVKSRLKSSWRAGTIRCATPRIVGHSSQLLIPPRRCRYLKRWSKR